MGWPARTPRSTASAMPASTRGGVLGRDIRGGGAVLVDVAPAPVGGLHHQLDVAVLAARAAGAAGGAHEAILALPAPGEGLAVGDLRVADPGADAELAEQPVDDDLEVELAHPGDHHLAGLGVRLARGTTGPRTRGRSSAKAELGVIGSRSRARRRPPSPGSAPRSDRAGSGTAGHTACRRWRACRRPRRRSCRPRAGGCPRGGSRTSARGG